MNLKKIAVIIGAGPAGLTAAYELINKSEIKPIVLEKSEDIGGISKTVNYKGNRMDIGGHRFFSKSDRVMEWWQNILPLEGASTTKESNVEISYQNKRRNAKLDKNGPNPENEDKVMLIRNRLSRIFYLRRFFDYPVSLNANTIRNLGIVRIMRIGMSYTYSRLNPIKKVESLEDFFINRFGKELYLTFFKDYTEKVWGLKCNEISAEWGEQRIKGLSVSKALAHAFKSIFSSNKNLEQKKSETSLIERFMYPKFGPGQIWEEVAKQVSENGGELRINKVVSGLKLEGNKIVSITVTDAITNVEETIKGDYFFSTMPVKELISQMEGIVPDEVKEVAAGLMYRDFITVGLLLKKLKIKNELNNSQQLIPDNWIYIQERDVKVGRLQIFNNWSPYMVSNPDHAWIGLEYFCNVGDELWSMDDETFKKFAIDELVKIDIIEKEDVIDSTIIRMEKTYPAYFGTYEKFHVIKNFTDQIDNLYLVGRNGMHKYNNSDHSMLTAMVAVENIINGITDKSNIWQVNTEQDYHESK